jgi:predicted RNA-binding protein with TRAM domain
MPAVDVDAGCATTTDAADSSTSGSGANGERKSSSFFPKKGQTLELVCESLGFKGKGICKVAETGFVLMCDRALPGERFLGRVSRKKSSYAEVFFNASRFSCFLFWLIAVNNS